MENSALKECFAQTLPQGRRFIIHHVSTPPTPSPAIFAPPPGESTEQTFCESHFLSVSIDSTGQLLQIFAIEVLIYTTEYLTTLFVSKADSTGYLYLLRLPQGTPSPLRSITTVLLDHLVKTRTRLDKKLVISLFARAQNQYLFPGSVENTHKHILDDRGLIKWWCKVVDPLLRVSKGSGQASAEELHSIAKQVQDTTSRGYLRVPGCESYEARALLPKSGPDFNDEKREWKIADPLYELGRSPKIPERCLIPRFPDDPKARFVIELDDELPNEHPQELTLLSDKFLTEQNKGRWRSVKSLEQFWELMSFRQECSSGRLVGFLWVVFEVAALHGTSSMKEIKHLHDIPQPTIPTPVDSQHQESSYQSPKSPLHLSPIYDQPSTPPPPISPSPSSTAPTPLKAKQAAMQAIPEETKYYHWPESGRGELVLIQNDYQRAGKTLLRLDYENETLATNSTRTWLGDVAKRAGVNDWGYHVDGTANLQAKYEATISSEPTVLSAGLVKKKKRRVDDDDNRASGAGDSKENNTNVLSAGLVRKKAKVADHIGPVSKTIIKNSKEELG